MKLTQGTPFGIAILSALALYGCAANLNFGPNKVSTQNPSLQQSALEASLTGTRVTFKYSDFYSLTSPSPNFGCAGDAKTFYDPIAWTEASGPVPLPPDVNDNTTTIRPAFIKNISVDLSDANSALTSNRAIACSQGNGATAPPPSSCATFDYGAIGGIPSLLGGTLLLMGGLQTTNFDGIHSYGGTSTSFNLSHGLTLGCGPTTSASITPGSAGYNSCTNSMYALGINTVPASAGGTSLAPGLTGPATVAISDWANLSAVPGYVGPQAKTGASATYNPSLQKVLLFGGASPLTGLNSTGAGSSSYDTWIFDLKTQKWSYSYSNTVISTSIQISRDLNPFPGAGGTPVARTLNQPYQGDGGRSLFGFAAIPGMAISQFGMTGLLTGSNAAPVDTTDRIAIVGGYCAGSSQGCQDVHIFNPTYAPEYMDAQAPKTPIISASVTNRDSFPSQWLNNYYMRNLSNSEANTIYDPTYKAGSPITGLPAPSPVSTPSVNDTVVSFGMVALNNNLTTSPGLGPNGNLPGAGYLAVAGGFHGNRSPSGYYNTPSGGTCTSLIQCGNLEIFTKWFSNLARYLPPTVTSATIPPISPPPPPPSAPWDPTVEQSASNFTSIGNITQSSTYTTQQGIQNTPGEWVPIPDSTAPKQTPWYGGAVMLKGLNNANNDVVYFGGADCQNYNTDPITCPYWPNVKPNPGVYWSFGTDPSVNLFSGGMSALSYPSVITMGGLSATSPFLPPINAGMAAARGTDPKGNPIIVAWGGMTKPTTLDNSGYIYYLYLNSSTGKPTWGAYQISSGAGPAGVSNASLVFSHVTGQFYLFGGYNPTGGSSSSTWQLSIGSTSPSSTCGSSTSASCSFSWTLLDTHISCYPNCPPARRSHRMVEANYNYNNAPNEPDCSSASAPCSFGLFMEGGTTDGISILGDRWLFDPTGNGGTGVWQEMGDMPPRSLSSIANVDYTIPATGLTVHRAILFGGETGLGNPYQAMGPGKTGLSSNTGYFVPPTLGDTWMFDYSNSSWNRVSLYGLRFGTSSIPIFSTLSEVDARSATLVTDSSSLLLTPPPTSGAIMVTRTQSRPNHSAADQATTLIIPEVYFFGGRSKNGKFVPISTIYKFCAGSTGEKPYPASLKGTAISLPDDATCDSFDALLNPQSPSPTQGYVGRWLMKTPTETYAPTYPVNSVGTFMGAGTYDTLHDRIVFYGGLSPNIAPVSGVAVTDTASLNSTGGALDNFGTVYEYTPPSSISDAVSHPEHLNGSWARIPGCLEGVAGPGFPTGRYGHTLAYDTLNQTLDLVGGYNTYGNLLTQTPVGASNAIPEIWTGYRIDQNLSSGIASRNIPAISDAPCYYWSKINVFGNLPSSGPASGLAHSTSVFVPASGYNTGYYTTDDRACVGAGPIASPDASISKLLAGGAYIDIDRTQLGANENLILNLTFLPLGASNIGSDQNYLNSDQAAVFRINLVKTSQSGDTIRLESQPRYLTYASTQQFPTLVQNLSLVSPPTGQIRQEQVYIPLSADPSIDRIRIERYSGNAILIDASIYRLGHN